MTRESRERNRIDGYLRSSSVVLLTRCGGTMPNECDKHWRERGVTTRLPWVTFLIKRRQNVKR